MLKLTMSTVDDSATVRVVTLITLVYLLFSFMVVGSPPFMCIGKALLLTNLNCCSQFSV